MRGVLIDFDIDFDKIKRILNIVLTVSFALLFAAVFLFLILHAAFGYSGLVVVSQSMWPKYSTGSFLIAKEIDPYELKTGDVITYRSITSNEYITHRIIDVQNNQGNLYFITQGDNNDTPDGNPVSEDRVVNKVLFGFNALGFMIQDAQDPVFLIEIVLLIILLWFIPVIIK